MSLKLIDMTFTSLNKKKLLKPQESYPMSSQQQVRTYGHQQPFALPDSHLMALQTIMDDNVNRVPQRISQYGPRPQKLYCSFCPTSGLRTQLQTKIGANACSNTGEFGPTILQYKVRIYIQSHCTQASMIDSVPYLQIVSSWPSNQYLLHFLLYGLFLPVERGHFETAQSAVSLGVEDSKGPPHSSRVLDISVFRKNTRA